MIEDILDYLRGREGKVNYSVPRFWVPREYDGRTREIDGKVFVDPYEFYSKIIEKILSKKENGKDYTKSIALMKGEASGDWIKKSTVYALFVRPALSYNHKGFGRFEPEDILGFRESGTFLKAMALLPILEELGVGAVYLLPVSEYSDSFRKGEIGSPYAVKNPISIDERYHDPILEDFGVEEEFKAFVEACHILGMRVLIDLIPRTASRDSDLIKDHPDWFYWIKVDELPSYRTPKVPGLGFKIPEESDLEYVYSLDEVRDHLRKFTFDPKTLDAKKWENLVRSDPDDLLSEIAREFGVVTPPGFSDWINDPQPPWEDVTFLRLYLDHPKVSKRFLDPDQPPYILFDVIKASLFPGEIENTELWDYVASVIPSYQERFGIDGVRLDMGHALPRKLEKMIMDRARGIDPAFVFVAEELDVSRDVKSKESGYDAIIGDSWWMMPRLPEKAYVFYQEIAPKIALPYLAAAETPDTPRIRARENGEVLKKLVPFLMAFAPNGVYFINSGQEIGEIQPLNLGLDNSDEGKAVLPPSDEFFAKLGFFDHYAYHWDEPDLEVFDFLKSVAKIRSEYSEILFEGDYRPVWFDWQDGKTANASYWKDDRGLVVVANLDPNPRRVGVSLPNTKGGEVRVEKVRVWDGSWNELEARDGWVAVDLEGFGFRLLVVGEV